MAISPESKAELEKLQRRIAEVDPSIMKIDPNDEDGALAIMIAGMVLAASQGSGSLTITAKGDGDPKVITIDSMGENSDGEPVVAVTFKSSDDD